MDYLGSFEVSVSMDTLIIGDPFYIHDRFKQYIEILKNRTFDALIIDEYKMIHNWIKIKREYEIFKNCDVTHVFNNFSSQFKSLMYFLYECKNDATFITTNGLIDLLKNKEQWGRQIKVIDKNNVEQIKTLMIIKYQFDTDKYTSWCETIDNECCIFLPIIYYKIN